MEANVKFPEAISRLHNLAELQQMAVVGATLIDYIEGNLTKMEAADALGLNYDGITDLLYELGIPSQMDLPDDLEQATTRSMEKLAGSLGINLTTLSD